MMLTFLWFIAAPVHLSAEVTPDKQWTIEFNVDIDPDSVEGNVFVREEGSDAKLDQIVSVEDRLVTVEAPEEGYAPGETYTLYIEGVESSEGVEMEGTVTESFKVRSVTPLEVHAIDVGQGDSIFIEYPNGKTMLIDGGEPSAGEEIVQYLKRAGITTIDQVIATHPDFDHIGGLIPVLETFDVNRVIDSGQTHTTDTYEDYISVIEEKNIPIVSPEEGAFLEMHPVVKTQVLNKEDPSAENNAGSLVFKLSYGEMDVLLTGDAGEEEEKEMVEEFDVEAEILKVGHHGSTSSTTEAFIEEVDPEAGILSYGEDNPYGHPADSVLDTLEGTDLYSTAAQGDILFTITEEDYKVNLEPWDQEEEARTEAINVNEAGYEALQKIPGVGEVIAGNIIDYRNDRGGFETKAELDEVAYIGQATLEQMLDYIVL